MIDEIAMFISSSSSETLGFGVTGLTGGASCFVGAIGGFGEPGFARGFDVAIGFFAAADQPQAEQSPLKFNASPHSLQSGTGWLASSSLGLLSADFGPAAASVFAGTGLVDGWVGLLTVGDGAGFGFVVEAGSGGGFCVGVGDPLAGASDGAVQFA